MGRYLPDDGSLVAVADKVIHDTFTNLSNVTIKFIFDTKKRVKKGNLTLATTELANEKLKYFTSDDEAPEGYDILVITDEKAWMAAKDDDKERLMRHELRHVFIDEKGRIKLIDHDVQDFMAEIKLNEDKPDWGKNLAQLTEAIYDQEADV